MTQATTTFAPVETGADGSTAGAIPLPRDAKMIKKITASVSVNGAMTTDTGIIVVLRLTGTNALKLGGQPEFLIGSIHLDDGGGTLTYTDTQILAQTIIDANVEVVGGANLTLQAAYYGTDCGSPEVSIELEVI